MRFKQSALVAVALGLLTACAHQNVALQSPTSLRAGASELTRQGHPNVAQSMLESAVEAAEFELAELYRALGDACQAQSQHARADEWYLKSVALKKFKAGSSPAQPMPAELPAKRLP